MGSYLGLAYPSAGLVLIDDDAAGYGWEQIDMLSVVSHELGHIVGLDHDVMKPTLAVGERQLPWSKSATVSVSGQPADLLTTGVQPFDELFRSWGNDDRSRKWRSFGLDTATDDRLFEMMAFGLIEQESLDSDFDLLPDSLYSEFDGQFYDESIGEDEKTAFDIGENDNELLDDELLEDLTRNLAG